MKRLVYTAHQRPFYFQPVLKLWQQVRGFEEWQPTVFLEPSASQEGMTRIAKEAGLSVRLNEQRLGVLRNPWRALNTAFTESADFVVLAEEDVVVSSDILEYFTWAAERFRDEHVLAICACSFADTCPPEQEQLVTISQHFCCLIWGTWSDRWTNVLRDTWDHNYSSGTPEHPESGWDWNINLRVMQDWNIISPVASRSSHIGEILGAHTSPETFPGSIAKTFRPDRKPAPFVF